MSYKCLVAVVIFGHMAHAGIDWSGKTSMTAAVVVGVENMSSWQYSCLYLKMPNLPIKLWISVAMVASMHLDLINLPTE